MFRMRPRLTSGALNAELAPDVGGALAALWLDRADGPFHLMRPLPEKGDDALHAAMFPMLPFANCIRDNVFVFRGRHFRVEPNMTDSRLNFHGSAWRSAWSLSEHTETTARLDLEVDDGIWQYATAQEIEIKPLGITFKLSVTNRGPEQMPFGIGFHPWFSRHASAKIAFAGTGRWTLDAEGLAFAHKPVDAATSYARAAGPPQTYTNTCYSGWTGNALISWPQNQIALRLTASAVLSHLMLHVPQGDPGTFCLEPQSNAPCAFDGLTGDHTPPGLHVLPPGGSLSAAMSFEIETSKMRVAP